MKFMLVAVAVFLAALGASAADMPLVTVAVHRDQLKTLSNEDAKDISEALLTIARVTNTDANMAAYVAVQSEIFYRAEGIANTKATDHKN